MAVREWSFARLWAAAAACWFVALAVGQIRHYVGYYFGFGGLAVLGIGLIPAFLAGAWAGSHPDIAQWPKARIVAMWAFMLGTWLAATESIGRWWTVGAALAAPVAILTIRWYELTAGSPRPRDLPPITVEVEPIVTPPPGSKRQLPG